jgi:hypothetical protein
MTTIHSPRTDRRRRAGFITAGGIHNGVSGPPLSLVLHSSVDQSMSALPDSISKFRRRAGPPPGPSRACPRAIASCFSPGWLIVLMPFLFWWNTWFGRQLSDGN